MKEEDIEKWANFLDTENLKDKLIFASLFIAMFESAKDYIIETVRDFFCTGWDTTGKYIYSENYKAKVLSRAKKVFDASLIFLKELDAITEEDVLMFDSLRQDRNKLSHELTKLLVDGLSKDLPSKLVRLMELRRKIEIWWFKNVEASISEISLDPETGIDLEGIATFEQAIFKVIFNMLSEDEAAANSFRDEFLKRVGKIAQ